MIKDRNSEIVRLYNCGEYLNNIAKLYGVSRQRICQIVKCQSNIVRRRNLDGNKSNPNESEEYAAKIIEEKGHRVEFNGYGGRYDLLIDNKLRVEVKHAAHNGKGKYAKFGGLNIVNFDVLICLVGELKKSDVYLIPASEIGTNLAIPFSPIKNTRKQRRYLNAWRYLSLQ